MADNHPPSITFTNSGGFIRLGHRLADRTLESTLFQGLLQIHSTDKDPEGPELILQETTRHTREVAFEKSSKYSKKRRGTSKDELKAGDRRRRLVKESCRLRGGASADREGDSSKEAVD